MTIHDLFITLSPRLKRIVARFRIPPAEAEDLVQEACLALVRHWAAIENPEAWLVRTLSRMCCTWLRRQRQRRWLQYLDEQILEAIAPAEEPPQERAELFLDMETLLAVLPRRSQQLVALRYGLGMTNEEIAARLGYRPASISKLSERVLERLRRSLREGA
ncbi:MAG TPA: sigma-70 family RNA polymerase sigma factor [Thermoanaerobaculia bacterium]|nr:sigma-70 family RNA polymerase sigma factor [Thermoanaerobaculia bacterium]